MISWADEANRVGFSVNGTFKTRLHGQIHGSDKLERVYDESCALTWRVFIKLSMEKPGDINCLRLKIVVKIDVIIISFLSKLEKI